MARTALDYKKLLKHLLPSGRAWAKDDASWLSQLLHGLAEEFSRIETRADDLLKEVLTKETVECITEHESDFNVESNTLLTMAERRDIINAKLISVGQQYKEYFEEIASVLGWTIQIEEYTPAWAGLAAAGCQANAQKNLFYWKVQVYADGDVGGFHCGFNPGGFESHYLNDRILIDQVVSITDISYLVSEIQRLKPAHTHPLFDFYGRGFARGFGWGYSSMPWYDDPCFPGGFCPAFGDGFANLRTYEGKYLVGGYSHGFNLGVDVHRGGGIDFKAFAAGFSRMQ